MKKIIFSLLAILASLTTNAQYVKLYKNGVLVNQYSNTEFDEVVFSKTPDVYTINGVEYPMPEAVDLGLPSGTKWASMNLGTYGEYNIQSNFYFGELFMRTSSSLADSYTFNMSGYPSNRSDSDPVTLLDKDDIVNTSIGINWHIPSFADWDELISNCNISVNSNEHYLFLTSKNNSKSIIIPFTSDFDTWYLSSTFYGLSMNEIRYCYWCYYFDETYNIFDMGLDFRVPYLSHPNKLCSIRPICK